MKYEEIAALNWSSLKNMAASPLMYRWREEHPRPDSATLALGRAVHCAVLEPEHFAGRYVVRPEGLDLRTKEGKAWRADVEDRGLEVLSADDGATIERCVSSVQHHPHARRLLEGTLREQEIQWIDAATGVHCKGRLDALDRQHVIDLKTCRDLSRFVRDSAGFLYHGQISWYVDGAIAAGVVDRDASAYVIAVESCEPYDCGVFFVAPEVLAVGRHLYSELLELWLACRDTGIWPGRYPSITDLSLPAWADSGVGVEAW